MKYCSTDSFSILKKITQSKTMCIFVLLELFNNNFSKTCFINRNITPLSLRNLLYAHVQCRMPEKGHHKVNKKEDEVSLAVFLLISYNTNNNNNTAPPACQLTQRRDTGCQQTSLYQLFCYIHKNKVILYDTDTVYVKKNFFAQRIFSIFNQFFSIYLRKFSLYFRPSLLNVKCYYAEGIVL